MPRKCNRRAFLLFFSLALSPLALKAASPYDLSTLYAYYRADVGTLNSTYTSTVTVDGSSIFKWQDQSGNGRDLTQATTAFCPVLDSTKTLVVSDGYQGADERFSTPASFILDRQNFALFAIVEATSFHASMVGASVSQYHFIAGSTGDTMNVHWDRDGRLAIYNSGNFNKGGVLSTIPSHRVLIGWVGTSTELSLWVNNVRSTTTALSSGNSTIESLLGYQAINQGTSQVGCKDLVVYSNSISTTNVVNTLWTWAQTRGVRTSTTTRVFAIGDSITHGYGATVNRTWPNVAAIGTTNDFYAMAESGVTINTLNSRKATYLDPLLRSNDIAIVFAGTNDLAGGATAATTEGILNTFCTSLRSGGVKVIVMTALPRNSGNITGYDTLIRSNWTGYADALVDLATDTRLDDNNDTGYYLADAIHPNVAGTQAIAQLLLPTLNNLLGRGPGYGKRRVALE